MQLEKLLAWMSPKGSLGLLILLLALGSDSLASVQELVPIWARLEVTLQSTLDYQNPLYEAELKVHFQSPSGRMRVINGFWDGGRTWRFRFQPDEVGDWTYHTECSVASDAGLHAREGSFVVGENPSKLPLFLRGAIVRPAGEYYLTYADGTPFFWFGDTAWNGALKSSDDEWCLYLQDRVEKGFNVIQFVTTQWRGGDRDRAGRVAFQGSGRIELDPEFFQRLDQKIDRINEHGLVAAPVLLWTLQFGAGRHLSPGYFLPENECVLLARYMVARYGGHHVVWILGGDGRYVDEYEQRWKNIGRRVFGDDPPGLVAQHPHGRSWIGDAYSEEEWLDIVGYQSSHSKRKETVEWINRGPMADRWNKLPARPLINLEPIYEQILQDATEDDVRRACYWSLFAAPPAGVSYGANGIWPWLREGEKILNHQDAPWTDPWNQSLDLPGAVQVGHLASFFRGVEWWHLRPLQQSVLVEQPGDSTFDSFVGVLGTPDRRQVLVYVPTRLRIRLRNPSLHTYSVRFYDPVKNVYLPGSDLEPRWLLEIDPPLPSDQVILLTADAD